MGMQIKINDNQLREITATLSEIRQRFKTVTTDTHFLRSVGQLLVSRAKQNLEDGGTPEKSYDLLKPATQRQKNRLGYSLKPLQRTGLMKRSLSHEISGGLKLTGWTLSNTINGGLRVPVSLPGLSSPSKRPIPKTYKTF